MNLGQSILFFLIYFFLIILILLEILVIALGIFFMFIGFKSAPYVPSHKKVIEDLLKEIEFKKGMKVADLGSGDGRVIIALAKIGCEAHGYEINPFLCWFTRLRIKKLGLKKQAFVHRKNFFSEDLSKFDLIFTYLLPKQMEKLEEKLLKELKTGSLVVSNAFSFPHWQPFKTTKFLKIYKKE